MRHGVRIPQLHILLLGRGLAPRAPRRRPRLGLGLVPVAGPGIRRGQLRPRQHRFLDDGSERSHGTRGAAAGVARGLVAKVEVIGAAAIAIAATADSDANAASIGINLGNGSTMRKRHLQPLIALLPIHRTPLAKLIRKLQRIQQPLHLVDAAAHLGVVDAYGPDVALWVDDEDGALGDALVLDEHAVVAADAVGAVGQQGDGDAAEAAELEGRGVPGAQDVFRVGADEGDVGVAGAEGGEARGEGEDFGRAHEGPGHGDEEEDEPVGGVG